MIRIEPLPPPTETFSRWLNRVGLSVTVREVYPGQWCASLEEPWTTGWEDSPYRWQATAGEALNYLRRVVQGLVLRPRWYRRDVAPIQAPAQFLPEEG